MNNIPYPYMQLPFPIPGQQQNYEEEINKLKYEVAKLKERVSELEQKRRKTIFKKKTAFIWYRQNKYFLIRQNI